MWLCRLLGHKYRKGWVYVWTMSPPTCFRCGKVIR